MPLVSDICFKCKRPVKSSVVCNTCQQHFHPGCARDYIKNRPSTDCCRKQLNYLLDSLNAKTRLASLKSTSSNTSSVSSFKSANSSPLERTFTVRGSTSSLKSPRTPISPLRQSTDSVFSSPVTPPTMSHLPVDWSKKSLDEKMTLLMEKFCHSEISTNQKLEDLSEKLRVVQDSQNATTVNLAELNTNVKTNAESICQISSDLKEVRKTREADMDLVNERLCNLENFAPVPSTSSQTAGGTTELVISGIPESVVKGSTPEDITTAVLNSLELPKLVNSVLSSRKFQNKNRQPQNQDKPITSSYIVSLISTPVRDFIIDKKRKAGGLLVKKVFPTYVDAAFQGSIYVNEFLLPETHRLLLKTKEKAKNKKYKFAWSRNGKIYMKKDENSERFVINCEADLSRLD
ncbi:uncharacterized protein LOC123263018 [Cotesia glomerata]|uniref:uncharacterized protein LOC123263018 n=1 Tax=Cotesia glomerata TaxID=32391 RepID=UPI001D007B06|nr:uncharacterized protein LOC123263018 [Cotesia glomerata]